MTPAREELIRDLKLWACSPRVPEKAQLLILEAIGALSAPPEGEFAKWIPCSEQMPLDDPDQLLNIAYKNSDGFNCVAIGTYDEGWSYEMEDERDEIQKWMRVPSPDKPAPQQDEQPKEKS